MEIDLDGIGSHFTITHKNTLFLDSTKNYEVALMSLETDPIPNIIEGKNNIFKYSTDNGINWKTIKLNTGAYDINLLNNEIQRCMIENKDYDITGEKFYINVLYCVPTATSVVSINIPIYKVNFDESNTVGQILGFHKCIIGCGYNRSQSVSDLMRPETIYVNCSITKPLSYVNGRLSHTIYHFSPDSPKQKIIERPNHLRFYPLITNNIDKISVWLTDIDDHAIDLRGERLSVSIYVREVTI